MHLNRTNDIYVLHSRHFGPNKLTTSYFNDRASPWESINVDRVSIQSTCGCRDRYYRTWIRRRRDGALLVNRLIFWEKKWEFSVKNFLKSFNIKSFFRCHSKSVEIDIKISSSRELSIDHRRKQLEWIELRLRFGPLILSVELNVDLGIGTRQTLSLHFIIAP